MRVTPASPRGGCGATRGGPAGFFSGTHETVSLSCYVLPYYLLQTKRTDEKVIFRDKSRHKPDLNASERPVRLARFLTL